MRKENAIKIQQPENMHIPMLRTLWKEAFGDTDEFLDMFFDTAFDVRRSRCVVIEDEVVAALYWFDCEQKIAYIYAVATAKKYRGQGLCQKLMEDTHSYLQELGYEGAVVVPQERELFAFYERMGYQTFCKVKEFSCDAIQKIIKITEIERTEYMHLRASYLPEGAVVQENENLAFLERYAKFYKGENYLLVANGEGERLWGIELLTSTCDLAENLEEKADGCQNEHILAGGILHSLGYKMGQFRMPSTSEEGRDFAMFYALTERAEVPSYFGLAFD